MSVEVLDAVPSLGPGVHKYNREDQAVILTEIKTAVSVTLDPKCANLVYLATIPMAMSTYLHIRKLMHGWKLESK